MPTGGAVPKSGLPWLSKRFNSRSPCVEPMTGYKELLGALLAAGVRFLIVGGYAAIAHGLTRATDDLDIWIEPTRDNASRSMQALRELGIDVESLPEDALADVESFFRIGEETGRKVDLMASPGGDIEFWQAWKNRFETEFLEQHVSFIGLHDLILTKRAVGRHRDLADIESLCAFHRLPNEGGN